MKNWQAKLKRTIQAVAVPAAYTLAILLLPLLVLSVLYACCLLADGAKLCLGLLPYALYPFFYLPHKVSFRMPFSMSGLLVSLVVAQVLVRSLFLKLTRGERQSRRQRSALVIIAALLLAQLHLWGAAATFCSIWGGKGIVYMFFGLPIPNYFVFQLTCLVAQMMLWGVWALVLRRLSQGKEAEVLFKYLLNWLAAGSGLVLLIAIVSQIRWRGSTSKIMTYFSMTTALGVLLLCIVPWLILHFGNSRTPLPTERPLAEPPEPP